MSDKFQFVAVGEESPFISSKRLADQTATNRSLSGIGRAFCQFDTPVGAAGQEKLFKSP
jgi:hypothetical protein